MYLVAITLARGLVTIWRLNDPEERHKMLQDSVKENAALRAEVSRYRGMIEYARAAPDFSSCKSILADALDGVNGAENYEEVKGEREILRARIEDVDGMAFVIAEDYCPVGMPTIVSPVDIKVARAVSAWLKEGRDEEQH